ncbi:MAG: cytochrome c [Myxococcales bacterium]|nr:cytochrome c [Myxococcales bacterium]
MGRTGLGLGVVLAGLLAAGPAQADGDAAKGKAKYATCVACHGANGEGNVALNAPTIAGQATWYLERQLKHFKDSVRGADAKDVYGMQMRPMAMILATDQDIADVAAHVSGLKAAKSAGTLGGDAAKGKALYAVCTACHGPKAEGMQALNSPRLTFQQDWYLLRQLKNFQSGLRGAHPQDVYGMQMAPMAKTLVNEQALKDVIAYIKSLEQ